MHEQPPKHPPHFAHHAGSPLKTPPLAIKATKKEKKGVGILEKKKGWWKGGEKRAREEEEEEEEEKGW